MNGDPMPPTGRPPPRPPPAGAAHHSQPGAFSALTQWPPSPTVIMLAIWLVFKLYSIYRKQRARNAPQGNVKGIHTPQEWVQALEEAKSNGQLLVVDFTATWCGPCQWVAPRFVELSIKYPNVSFVKVDVDEVKAVSSNCGVRCMPTFQFYRDSRKVDAMEGAQIPKLEELITKYGGKAEAPGAKPVKAA